MANKPILITAAVIMLISVGSLAVAGAAISSVEEDIESVDASNYLSDASTSHQIIHTDDDGAGSSGWLILIEGDDTDADNNGRSDACEAFTYTVKSDGEDVTNTTSQYICNDDDEKGINELFPDLNLIGAVSVCDTYDDTGYEDLDQCFLGKTYTIESNTSMTLFDADSYYIAIIDELGGFIGELLGGSCLGILGVCCSIVLLIVGLVVGGNQQPPVMMGGVPTGQIPAMGYQAPVGQMPQQQYQTPVQQTMPQGQVVPNAQMTQQPAEQQPQSNVWDEA